MTQRRTKASDQDEGGGGVLWLAIYWNGIAAEDLKQLMMIVWVWIDGKRCCSGDDVAFDRLTLMLGPNTGTELEPSINGDLPNASTSSVTLIWTKGTEMNVRIL